MEEQLRILKMIEDRIITAEQAAILLDAIGGAVRKESGIPKDEAPSNGKIRSQESAENNIYDKKMFHIQITAIGVKAINLQFPVLSIQKLLKATGKIPIICDDLNGINLKDLTGLDLKETLETISSSLDAKTSGDIINIDSGDGNSVRIFVE